MKKILVYFLIMSMLLAMTVGCGQTEQPIDPTAVLQHLLNDVAYDSELINTGDLASIYFADLPADATVSLFVSDSGYFPDEVALISVTSESSVDSAKNSINNHLSQVRNQFLNYLPEQVGKIDKAITWQSGNHIFVVITNDTKTANDIFSRAHELVAEGTLPAAEAPTTAPTTAATEPTETEPIETTPPTTIPPETEPQEEPTIISKSGTYFIYPNGVVKVDNAAYEPYGFVPASASKYVEQVNKVADELKGITNVYCLPIPTAIAVTFPDDIAERYRFMPDQAADLDIIISQMNENVTPINCLPTLRMHRDEYLYYRTDYHWNGPAAYYAYETFCKVKGFTPYTMEQRRVAYFDNFLGALWSLKADFDTALSATPDTVIAYYPYSENATMFFANNSGKRTDYDIICDVSKRGSGDKYLCYAAADQPYAEFHNPDVTDGSSLILVKESYGNVLLSYLVDHYSVIYEIDYRYWRGNIIDLAKEVGATDLMFANNMTMISSSGLIGMLSRVIN